MDWLFMELTDEERTAMHERFVSLADAYSRQFDALCEEALG